MPNEFIARNGLIAQNDSIITGSLTVTGTITATTLVAQTITSSTSWITGSTKFGSITSNTHQFTGSILQSGSLAYFAGSVGIGTASPSFNLDVAGNIGINGRLFAFNSATYTQITDPAGGIKLYLGASGDPGNYYDNTSHTFRSIGGSTTYVTINSNGSVGIGTTSPSVKLHVKGDAVDEVGLALIQNDYASGNVYFPALSVINTRGNHSYGIVTEFRTNTSGDGDRPSILFYGAQATQSWQVGQVTSGWGTNDAFGIGYRASNTPGTFASWPTNYFTILTGGNVGIGSTSPSTKLDVIGDTFIKGVIFGYAGSGGNQFGGLTWNSTDDGLLFLKASNVTKVNLNSNGVSYFNGGNIGINNTTPQYKLDVNGGSGFAASFGGTISPGAFSGIHFGYLETPNTAYRKSALVFERTDNHSQGGNASGKIYMLLDNRSSNSATTLSAAVMTWDTDAVATLGSARVGIGTTSPAYTLDVSGTIRATGDVIAYSDARVKDNVTTVENALDKVKSLRGVTYTRKDDDTKSLKVGVIAQEVLPILPEVVQQDNNGNYSVAYGNMVGVLIEAIKEQQRQIDDLKYLLQTINK